MLRNMNYQDTKLQQLNAGITYRVYGHALEFDQEEGEAESTRIAIRKRWTGMSPCLCVQDNLRNPCPCDNGMVWWLPSDSIVAHGKSGRKDQHGEDLQFYDVCIESNIMVESLQPMNVGALKGLGRNVTAPSVLNLARRTDGSSVLTEPLVTAIAQVADPDPVVLAAIFAAVVDSFSLKWVKDWIRDHQK